MSPEVTADVVRDLLPAYASGEASPATRQLVEAWLAREPALAREAEALGAVERALAARSRKAPAADGEAAALLRVRGQLRAQSIAMAGGIFFTLLPLTILVKGGEVKFLMLRDLPGLAAVSVVAGLACWIAYVRSVRGMRAGAR